MSAMVAGAEMACLRRQRVRRSIATFCIYRAGQVIKMLGERRALRFQWTGTRREIASTREGTRQRRLCCEEPADGTELPLSGSQPSVQVLEGKLVISASDSG